MFNHDFLWGGSLSSMQSEGAWNEDGKGLTTYDIKKIKKHSSDWKNAIDFYHHYKDDIKLFKELGFNCLRISISWARIFPLGEGQLNEKGLKFYENVIDELLSNNIEPIICVYHYDYPLELLHKYGSWNNKAILEAWKDYVDVLVKRFGQKVKYWIPFNEQNSTYFGNELGVMLLMDSSSDINKRILDGWHHCNIASAYLRMIVKKHNPQALVGTMINYTPIYAKNSHPKSSLNVMKANDIYNHLTLDVMVNGEYPQYIKDMFAQLNYQLPSTDEEMQLLKESKVDFVGFSYYFSFSVGHEYDVQLSPMEFLNVLQQEMFSSNPYLSQSEWGWNIDHTGIRIGLNDLHHRYHLPILVLEIGLGKEETLNKDYTVYDSYRIDYLKNQIQSIKEAVDKDGVHCFGILTWGPIDILSSKGEMKKRYGFIYVNRNEKELLDMKRYRKKSFYWYQKVIKTNGKDLSEEV